jgi:hypothetical protein
MSDELRTAVLDAIAGDGATLVEIHERTGEDSRRTLAMLHVLAGQKVVTCAREEGRGMVWSLTDEADLDAQHAAPAAPATPPARRVEPEPLVEQRRNQTGISMADRRQHSVRTQVLRHVLALTRMERSGAISDALQLPVKQVNNALWMLVDSGRIERIGDRGSAVYGPKGLRQPHGAELQPEVAVNITRAIEKAAPPLPEPRAPDAPAALPPGEIIVAPTRRALLVAVTVRVPIDKASAVCRAIEQALA